MTSKVPIEKVVILALCVAAFLSPTATTPVLAQSTGKISLLDAEPALYHGMPRYRKFYGDPNLDSATIDGSLFDRQYLFGSFWGRATRWRSTGWSWMQA